MQPVNPASPHTSLARPHGLTRRQCAAALAAATPWHGAMATVVDGAALGPAAGSVQSEETSALLKHRLQAEGVGLAAAQFGPQATAFSNAGRRQQAPGAAAVQADTVFEWGSITKTLTATLLAQLVVQGRIQLNDAVQEALPGGLKLVDSHGDPVRWLDLATHRSGLPRLPSNLAPAVAADPYADYDDQALWAFLDRWKPELPRHSRWAYSNLGFGLLGCALGRVAGSDFKTALQATVLQPLALDTVALRITGSAAAATAPLAQGHDAAGLPAPAWHFQTLAGAGAAAGSARQLSHWGRCVLGLVGHPLEQAMRLATQQQAEGASATMGMGLGWMRVPFKGRTLLTHDGGTFGFSSSVVLDMETRRGAAVLANASVPVTDLALHLLDSSAPLRDRGAERAAAASAAETARQTALQRPAQPVDAQQLAPLAGVYALNAQFKITIQVQGQRLFAQATGQPSFELFASEARRYFARVTPLDMHFEGSDGPPAALLLLQAGQQLRFVRE